MKSSLNSYCPPAGEAGVNKLLVVLVAGFLLVLLTSNFHLLRPLKIVIARLPVRQELTGYWVNWLFSYKRKQLRAASNLIK